MKIAAIVFIILGVLMIAYTGFNYVTTDKVVDLGAIQINKQTNHPVEWSPILGASLLAGGIAILVFGKKNGSNT